MATPKELEKEVDQLKGSVRMKMRQRAEGLEPVRLLDFNYTSHWRDQTQEPRRFYMHIHSETNTHSETDTHTLRD